MLVVWRCQGRICLCPRLASLLIHKAAAPNGTRLGPLIRTDPDPAVQVAGGAGPEQQLMPAGWQVDREDGRVKRHDDHPLPAIAR